MVFGLFAVVDSDVTPGNKNAVFRQFISVSSCLLNIKLLPHRFEGFVPAAVSFDKSLLLWHGDEVLRVKVSAAFDTTLPVVQVGIEVRLLEPVFWPFFKVKAPNIHLFQLLECWRLVKADARVQNFERDLLHRLESWVGKCRLHQFFIFPD